jgi:hypothetical protein
MILLFPCLPAGLVDEADGIGERGVDPTAKDTLTAQHPAARLPRGYREWSSPTILC